MIDGGTKIDTDCWACATVNCYLVTYEVVAVVEMKPKTVAGMMDGAKMARPAGVAQARLVSIPEDGSVETSVQEKNSTPAMKDDCRALNQDSQYLDDRDKFLSVSWLAQIAAKQCYHA